MPKATPTRAPSAVPLRQVRVSGGFWGPCLETNRTRTLPIPNIKAMPEAPSAARGSDTAN